MEITAVTQVGHTESIQNYVYNTSVNSKFVDNFYKLSKNSTITVIKIFRFSTIQTAMKLEMFYNTALQL